MYVRILFCTILTFYCAGCQASVDTDTISVNDRETLIHFKTVLWPQAYRTNDTALLDTLLHDDFQFVQADGNISTKQKEIEFLKTSEWKPKSFRYEITRLQVFHGNFAVVSGTGHGVKADGTAYTYTSSNHLIKEDGRWQAISSHVSGYKELDQNQEHN